VENAKTKIPLCELRNTSRTMSQNNETLVIEHNGRWLVFRDVIAEAWGDDEETIKEPTLSAKDAKGNFDTKEKALEFAFELDAKCGQWEEGTEYGVVVGKLIKDGTKVKVID